jgi:hypothetical protein
MLTIEIITTATIILALVLFAGLNFAVLYFKAKHLLNKKNDALIRATTLYSDENTKRLRAQAAEGEARNKYASLLSTLTCTHPGCNNLRYYTTPLPMDKAENGITKGYLDDFCTVHLMQKFEEKA